MQLLMTRPNPLGNQDIRVIEELYSSFREDPESVDTSWQLFFSGFDLAIHKFPHLPGKQVPEAQYRFRRISRVELHCVSTSAGYLDHTSPPDADYKSPCAVILIRRTGLPRTMRGNR